MRRRLTIPCLSGALLAVFVVTQSSDAFALEVPKLGCAGAAPTEGDIVNFNISGSCSTNDHGKYVGDSKNVSGWTGGAMAAAKECDHGRLKAKGAARMELSCVGLPEGAYRLHLEAFAQALAGYRLRGTCDGGNYCGAKAAASGVAITSFMVGQDQVGQYCIALIDVTGKKTGERGYKGRNGSKWFEPGTWTVTGVELTKPYATKLGGPKLGVANGASYLIDATGAWKISLPASVTVSSNMAENSGQYLLSPNLQIQFVQARADGTCPAVTR